MGTFQNYVISHLCIRPEMQVIIDGRFPIEFSPQSELFMDTSKNYTIVEPIIYFAGQIIIMRLQNHIKMGKAW